MTTWNVLVDKNGKAVAAGFCEFIPEEGETVNQLDAPDKAILEEVEANRKAAQTPFTDEQIKYLKAKGAI